MCVGSGPVEGKGSLTKLAACHSRAFHALQVQSLDYDCVVFDTAPTGHTLRLLQFPATLDKALGKLVSMRGAFGGMLGQVAAMLGGPADGIDGIMSKLDQLKARGRRTEFSMQCSDDCG